MCYVSILKNITFRYYKRFTIGKIILSIGQKLGYVENFNRTNIEKKKTIYAMGRMVIYSILAVISQLL